MKLDSRTEIADRLRNEFEKVAPFIQEHTSKVCPLCSRVCCINKHGYYDGEDVLFVMALGIKIPPYSPDRSDADPCRFLNARGCSLQRWERPFRCTWYFCDSLLESMREDNSRAYRKFIESLQNLVAIRRKFIEECSRNLH
jgi:hypothetical protein